MVLMAHWPVQAATLAVRLDDGTGPVPDAIVSLHGEHGSAVVEARAVMDQRNTSFVPGVLAVRVGTSVSFPNSDTVQHQVYSFSPAKPFELPLYSGTPLAPVLFDRPGVVVVGCNIHDWMIGYIVVMDTDRFAKTDAAGVATIEAPAGTYRLQIWHSRLAAPVEQSFSLGQAGAQPEIRLALGPPPPERRGSERLRALQEKLRRIKQDP